MGKKELIDEIYQRLDCLKESHIEMIRRIHFHKIPSEEFDPHKHIKTLGVNSLTKLKRQIDNTIKNMLKEV